MENQSKGKDIFYLEHKTVHGPIKNIYKLFTTQNGHCCLNLQPADLSGKNMVNPLVPLRTTWSWWSSGRICTQRRLSSPLKAGWAFLSLYLHHIAPMSQSPARKHNIRCKHYQMIIIIITLSSKLSNKWVNITWGPDKPYWVTDKQVTNSSGRVAAR